VSNTDSYLWFLIIIGAGIGFVFGWKAYARKAVKERLGEAKQLFTTGKSAYEKGDYLEALVALVESAGHYSQHYQTWGLIGEALSKLHAHKLAAWAFDRAFMMIQFNTMGLRDIAAGKAIPRGDWVTYYRYRSAHAYCKQDNWHFAGDRADGGITAIRNNRIPKVVGGNDFEEEFVAIRLFAALHSTNENDPKPLRADADWLLSNAKRQVNRGLVEAAFALDKIPDLVRAHEQRWWKDEVEDKEALPPPQS
jgi:hypothetical protein